MLDVSLKNINFATIKIPRRHTSLCRSHTRSVHNKKYSFQQCLKQKGIFCVCNFKGFSYAFAFYAAVNFLLLISYLKNI